jgi:hypothetical protein
MGKLAWTQPHQLGAECVIVALARRTLEQVPLIAALVSHLNVQLNVKHRPVYLGNQIMEALHCKEMHAQIDAHQTMAAIAIAELEHHILSTVRSIAVDAGEQRR